MDQQEDIFELLKLVINNRNSYEHKKNFLEQLDKLENVNDIRSIDQHRTLLMEASKHALTDIIEILCNKGADLEITDDDGATAFLLACWSYRLVNTTSSDHIIKLLAYKPNINHQDLYGNTPLIFLCWEQGHTQNNNINEREDIALHLIELGADITLARNYEATIFTVICWSDISFMPRLQKKLVSMDAHIKQIKKGSTKEFEHVCRYGNTFIAEELLKAGTIISQNAVYNLMETATKESHYIFDLIFDKIDQFKDKSSIRAIYNLNVACRYKNEYVVTRLIEHGVNINKDLEYTGTHKIITNICNNKWFPMIDTLLDKVDDFFAKDKSQNTPLQIILMSDYTDFAIKYIEHFTKNGQLGKIYNDEFITTITTCNATKAVNYMRRHIFSDLFLSFNRKGINKHIRNQVQDYFMKS
jgi:ankyrin repeat protein